MAIKLKVKKGDQVIITTGKDKGKKGEIISVDKEKYRVRVSGINLVKDHTKAGAGGSAGGIIQKEASIHISNVTHIDPKTSKPTKVGYKLLKDGKKVRFAKKSGEVIE